MSDKYYTDEELLNFLADYIVPPVEIEQANEMIELLRERFSQKDKQREYIQARLNEAANIIGHNTISESMMYEWSTWDGDYTERSEN